MLHIFLILDFLSFFILASISYLILKILIILNFSLLSQIYFRPIANIVNIPNSSSIDKLPPNWSFIISTSFIPGTVFSPYFTSSQSALLLYPHYRRECNWDPCNFLQCTQILSPFSKPILAILFCVTNNLCTIKNRNPIS